MPAYRSSAEAEVRGSAIARLRKLRPNARIIHEINNGHSNRIDVLAVDASEIIACEIKSEKDTLDLLLGQVSGMREVAHRTVIAVHECLLNEIPTNEHYARYERDGVFYRKQSPIDFMSNVEVWIYPEVATNPWRAPNAAFNEVLPQRALQMVWKDELIWLCSTNGIKATSRSTAYNMREQLLWHCSGRDLTKGICNVLRARQCIEADPAIPLRDLKGFQLSCA